MLGQLAPFMFLALFQGIGGLVAGDGLRKIFAERQLRGVMLVVWGGFFGGIPALLGVAAASQAALPQLRLAGPLVFLGALLVGALILPWLVREVGAGTLASLAVGLGFMLGGGGMAAAIVHSGKGATWIGLIVSAIFALVGVWMCWTAISPLLQGTSIDDRQSSGLDRARLS